MDIDWKPKETEGVGMKKNEKMIELLKDCANSIDELEAKCDWEDGEAIAYAVKKYVISEIIRKVRAMK